MPVESIELMHRHQIQRAHHLFFAEKVPTVVEVDTTPTIARRVLNLDERSASLLGELLQGLARVEAPRLI